MGPKKYLRGLFFWGTFILVAYTYTGHPIQGVPSKYTVFPLPLCFVPFKYTVFFICLAGRFFYTLYYEDNNFKKRPAKQIKKNGVFKRDEKSGVFKRDTLYTRVTHLGIGRVFYSDLRE